MAGPSETLDSRQGHGVSVKSLLLANNVLLLMAYEIMSKLIFAVFGSFPSCLQVSKKAASTTCGLLTSDKEQQVCNCLIDEA